MALTAPANTVPAPIDYTSRDFLSLREDLIARVKERVADWNGSDPADFGVALIEAVAHLGDLLAFYADRIAAETFIASAARRESLIQHARALGYYPSGFRAAIGEVIVTNTSSEYVLPRGTQFVAQVETGNGTTTEYYETVGTSLGAYDLTIPAAGSAVAILRHGRTLTEELGRSSGLAGMVFRLLDYPVVEDSVQIKVNGAVWSEVLNLLDANPGDTVYRVLDNGEGVVTIEFGDGISGAIPPLHAVITATYVCGGGTIGNMSAGTSLRLLSIPGLTPSEINAVLTNLDFAVETAAAGGTNPESNDQIRWTAPYVGRVMNRAVTLKDHASLALEVSGVGMAGAAQVDPTTVKVYVAPYRAPGHADPYPGGKTVPNYEYAALLAAVQSFLSERTLLGITVQVERAAYADVTATIDVTCFPQYLREEVEQSVMASLLAVFGYPYMDLDMTLTAQDLEFVLGQVDGVKRVRVSDIRHEYEGEEGWSACDGQVLIGQPNAVWIFREPNVTLTLTGGITP